MGVGYRLPSRGALSITSRRSSAILGGHLAPDLRLSGAPFNGRWEVVDRCFCILRWFVPISLNLSRKLVADKEDVAFEEHTNAGVLNSEPLAPVTTSI
jgi:hypothetical protein